MTPTSSNTLLASSEVQAWRHAAGGGGIMLCGPAASGKSTLAGAMEELGVTVISPDRIRADAGLPADERRTTERETHRLIASCVRSGSPWLLDATNLHPAAREDVARTVEAAGGDARDVAVWVMPPQKLSTLIDRDTRRGGRVDPGRIAGQHRRHLELIANEDLAAEGWGEIAFLEDVLTAATEDGPCRA